jgi:hypothetical protein
MATAAVRCYPVVGSPATILYTIGFIVSRANTHAFVVSDSAGRYDATSQK